MRRLLKKYDAVEDIIIFGSFVKGRASPRDIDLAFIVKDKNADLARLLKMGLPDKAHLEFIDAKDVYSSTLFLSLMNEGYSIKKDAFLRQVLKTRPMRLYSYDLKHLDRSKKTLFGMALKKALNKIGGEKVGSGAVLVPINQSSYFEDFLDAWGLKYKTKEWTVI